MAAAADEKPDGGKSATHFKLPDGICQVMFGYRFFDLNIVDKAMGLSSSGLHDIRKYDKILEFRLCNQGLDIDDGGQSHMQLNTCENKRHAYLGQLYGATDETKRNEFKCFRSFARPQITGYTEDPESQVYSGYDLEMESTQEKDGEPKTTFKLKVRCDEEDTSDEVKWNEVAFDSNGEIVFEYKGKYGC